jgi:hypothetical protein
VLGGGGWFGAYVVYLTVKKVTMTASERRRRAMTLEAFHAGTRRCDSARLDRRVREAQVVCAEIRFLDSNAGRAVPAGGPQLSQYSP